MSRFGNCCAGPLLVFLTLAHSACARGASGADEPEPFVEPSFEDPAPEGTPAESQRGDSSTAGNETDAQSSIVIPEASSASGGRDAGGGNGSVSRDASEASTSSVSSDGGAASSPSDDASYTNPSEAAIPSGSDAGGDAGRTLVIDDFSTCNPTLRAKTNTYWYSYDDTPEPNRGTSTSVASIFRPGFGGSPCALRWTGTVTTAYTYGFAGLGLDVRPIQFGDRRRLLLMVRGDGRNYRISLPMSTQIAAKEYNFYGAVFSCGNGTPAWFGVPVETVDLKQESGWGIVRPLDVKTVVGIQIQTMDRPIAAFQCDIGLVRLTD